MTTTRPDLVNLPELTNPTDGQTEFVVQDSGVNQTLSAQRTREFLGNQIGPTGPQGPQGVQGPQGPQGVQGPQGPTFYAYSSSTVTPGYGTRVLVTTSSNHAFVTGNRVLAISSTTNFFEGVLTLASGNVFSINSDFHIGASTTNTWTISLTGQRGSTGPQGPQGVQGPTGPRFYVTSVSTATPASVGNIVLIANTSDHAFVTGNRVIAINATNNFFEGVVTITGGTAFTIAADYNIGTTAANTWTVSLTGQRGATGPQGPQGVTGPTGPGLFGISNSSATPDGVSLTTLTLLPQYVNHQFVKGVRVVALNTESNFFEGTITNNVVGNLSFIIQQDYSIGSTAGSNWTIGLAGRRGPSGPVGPTGGEYSNTATNIAGGQQGSIPIQLANSTTRFISPGSNGNLLRYDSNTATWVGTSTLQVGIAINAEKVAADLYTTSELLPSKYIGIIDYFAPPAYNDLGIQSGLTWNTNQELMGVPSINVTKNQESTSTITGALTVIGGIGLGGSLTAGGIIRVKNISTASSTQTGALVVEGGAGIGGNLYVGGTIVAQQLTIELTTVTTTLIQTDDIIKTANLTAAVSTTTGALQVAGGAGIGGDLYVGGNLYPLGVIGITTTATNLQGGNSGQVPYQQSPGITKFINTGSTGSILVSRYLSSPVWQNTLTLDAGINATSTITGTLVVIGGAGITQDLYVGGTIFGVVTSATFANSATFATSATWAAFAANALGNSSTSNLLGGGPGQVVFQTATNFTGFTPAGTAGDVFVSAGSTSTGPVFQNTLTLAGVTVSTSTQTGALQVRGGVGVGGNVYLAGWLQVGVANTTAYSTGTAGEIRATNEITAYFSSDKNLKENLKLINNPLTLIDQINGYYFDWKDDYIQSRGGEDGYFVRKQDIGVIAQEIEQILPEIVGTRQDGFKAVRYEKIVPLLIESIKELHREVEILKKQISTLSSQ